MAAAAWARAPPLAERADRRFTALDLASFTETGAGSRNLAVSGQAVSSVRTLLGGRLSRDIDLGEGIVINTSLKLGWAHALSDTGRTTTASFASTPGSTFAIEGAQRRRDGAIVGMASRARSTRRPASICAPTATSASATPRTALIGGVRFIWLEAEAPKR
jgi:hypothetical protein